MGAITLGLWVAAQVWWLQQGFQLEFNGSSTFVPGLWAAGLGFYIVNMFILGVVVDDVRAIRDAGVGEDGTEEVARGKEKKVIR